MAQGDRGTLGLVDCATPDVTFGGVTNWSLTTGLARQIAASGGEVDPTFAAVMDIRPSVGFTTRQLTALSSFGIAGAEITNLDAWVQKLVKYGTRAGATSHTKLTIPTGMCVPRTLSAAQGQIATLGMEAIAISSDGTTAAATVTVAQNLPTGGLTSLAWTLGPIVVNGTTIECESVTVDFGINLIVTGSGGQVYPTFIAVMDRRPTIRCTSKDLDTINTLYSAGVFAVAQGATDSVVYFRKLAANGTRVADATAEHIKLTVDDGLISLDAGSLQQGDISSVDFVIEPISDGSNAIIVVSTASAIT